MHDETFDLQTCLSEVRLGDQTACLRLVEHLYPLVAKIVGSYVRREADRDDWQQEIFVRMFMRLDQYRAEAPFEHWLSRIAVNTCIDQLRKRGRCKEICLADLSESEEKVLHSAMDSGSNEAVDAFASRELVGKLLDSLSAEDRVVLTLLDLEQKSVAEIAGQLDRSESWVKVRAHRARKKLRPILQRLTQQ